LRNTLKARHISLIDYALSVLNIAQEKVGGRIVLVECNNEVKLIKFYNDNGFSFINLDTDGYAQLIKIIA